MTTTVDFTRFFEKRLSRCPKNVQRKAILWIKAVETEGIREVRKVAGFHDEPLKGKRQGQRSVRLNRSYRLIYEETEAQVQILLLEVTNHVY
jgi:proteic killer suppression protein